MAQPDYYIGIGASAGGLDAIEHFFKNMPPDTGFAFILIQHLSPDHKSMMLEILSKHTSMSIYRAEDNQTVEANCIYLIPPGKNLSLFHGQIILSDQDKSRNVNLPIDLFFRSLAEDQAEKAVAIVLSGTGSDGSRGIKDIKEAGGLVMVQDEESAAFDGMPRNAVNTGVVDLVTTPQKMPGQLVDLLRHSGKDTDKPVLSGSALNHIFSMVRLKTGVDFSQYKPNTVNRRIDRRMSICRTDSIDEYLSYLEKNPVEVVSLYREILIGVTSFFRDPVVWENLEGSLIEILKKSTEDEVRFWVCGCSSGEEAYTLAMITAEVLERNRISRNVKIFATDVDTAAIHRAGTGIYTGNIVPEVGQQRAAAWFERTEEGNYRISRQIREMVIFAAHNAIKDPPFTNISLISCRNLMIYLKPEVQGRLLEMFNFSLNQGGMLLLGPSETTGDYSEFFDVIDQRIKMYRSRGLKNPRDQRRLDTAYSARSKPVARETTGMLKEQQSQGRLLYEKIIQRLAGNFFKCALLVDQHGDLLHVFGDAAGILHFPPGKMVSRLSKIIHPELSVPVVTGIQKAVNTKNSHNYSRVRLHTGQGIHEYRFLFEWLNLDGQSGNILLIVEQHALEPDKQTDTPFDIDQVSRERISKLEQDLQFNRENLQATIEELETSNEELQATNEELLASNEELQSTNEELQSVNEELYTVNNEYQRKIIELTEANNDITNILQSSRTGFVLVDENYEIRRFTEMMSMLFKLTPADIGRPVYQVNHVIGDLNIYTAMKKMKAGSEPLAVESTVNGRHYLFELAHYMISEKMSSGFILSATDVSSLRMAQEKNTLQAELLDSIHEAVIATTVDGQIIYWNRRAENLYGWRANEVLGKNIVDVVVPDTTREQAEDIMNALIAGRSWKGSFNVKRKDGSEFAALVTDSPVTDAAGRLTAIIGISDAVERIRKTMSDIEQN